MSADIELLRLAAKAAGVDVGADDFCDAIGRKYSDNLGLWVRTGTRDIGRWFNPLNDDGEALRLAVKLRLKIDLETSRTVFISNFGWAVFIQDDLGSDPYAATRRAIVLAAAAIGKAMP